MDNPITQKLGPLPVWGWGLIISGGIWAYYYWTGKGAGDTAPGLATDSTWLPDDTSNVDLTGQSGSSSGLVNSPGLPVGGTPAPQTVEAWASIVADWLIGNGAPVASVQSAFAKLVRVANGELPAASFTTQEVALINQGVQKFGSAPGGPLQYSATPTAPATTPPATNGARTWTHGYHIRSGDTWETVAGRYRVSPTDLWHHNPTLHRSDKHLQAGWVMLVPTG